MKAKWEWTHILRFQAQCTALNHTLRVVLTYQPSAGTTHLDVKTNKDCSVHSSHHGSLTSIQNAYGAEQNHVRF